MGQVYLGDTKYLAFKFLIYTYITDNKKIYREKKGKLFKKSWKTESNCTGVEI